MLLSRGTITIETTGKSTSKKQPTYVEAGRLANVHTAMTEPEVQSEP